MKIFARRWRTWETLPPRVGFRGEFRFGTRLFSISHDGRAESFKITCGSAGHITVDIHNSHALSSPTTPLIIYLPPLGTHLLTKNPPIPPFLLSPNFPLAQINYRWNHTPSPANRSTLLSSSPNFTNHPFPTPLHDTLHAWTWLIEHYLPSLTNSLQNTKTPLNKSNKPYITPPNSPNHRSTTTPRPIIIYGSHLGGTLGTVLGLTESHIIPKTRPKILGLIIHNGIFDWTSIATTKDPSLPSLTYPSTSPDTQAASASTELELEWDVRKQWTTRTLHKLKTHLFTSPASAFDPFASPTLFFHSSGLSPSSTIPRYFPGHAPPPSPSSPHNITAESVAGLNISDAEREDLLSMIGAESDVQSLSDLSGKGKEKEEETLEYTRKSPLKFPPTSSGLKIPRALFLYDLPPSSSSSSSSSPPTTPRNEKPVKRIRRSKKGEPGNGAELELKNQAEEIVRVMRRSIVIHEFRDRVRWGAEGEEEGDAVAESEERVRISGVHAASRDGGVDGKDGEEGGEGEGELSMVVREWIEEIS